MTQSPPSRSASTPRKILCVGMPVRDLVFRVRDLPPRGHKLRAESFEEIAGGNALNAAIGIARLGGAVSFCGPMGDRGETPSRYIFDQLAREGIEAEHVVHMDGLVTPISNIMIDPSGERTVVTFRDDRLWQVSLPPADDLLRGCHAVLTENRCAGFVTELCAEARRRGLPVILDADQTMSLREGLLMVSSHVIFSAEALSATAGTQHLEDALRRLKRLTPAFLAVTTGSHGMIWLEGDNARHMPAFPVHTVDTLGAGDVFHGAFALAMAEGAGIEDAMRFSAAAAALKCTRPGGAFAAPTRAEVGDFLARTTEPAAQGVK